MKLSQVISEARAKIKTLLGELLTFVDTCKDELILLINEKF